MTERLYYAFTIVAQSTARHANNTDPENRRGAEKGTRTCVINLSPVLLLGTRTIPMLRIDEALRKELELACLICRLFVRHKFADPWKTCGIATLTLHFSCTSD